MAVFSQQDEQFMQMAIELAKQGQFTTTPNPNVGCVLVKDGKIVGQGFHIQAGGPHAEVHALRQAGDAAKGATAYVTLEPCSHFGRTPPCAKGLIEAGVAKVIAAMVDPNPKVSGKGLAMLEQAGIEIAFGLLESQAYQLNEGFFKRMKVGLPFVQCKLAASLDGKTALASGESKWITSPAARDDVQRFRAKSCAIISGADTVLTDNAQLTVRAHFYPEQQEQIRQPVRVIFDSQARLTPELALFASESPVILVRTDSSPVENALVWPHFVEEFIAESKDGKIDCHCVLRFLAQRGINQVWLEAGQTLCGVFHDAGLIDEYIVYYAPKIIGEGGKGLFSIASTYSLSQVETMSFSHVQTIGQDLRVHVRKIN
ncbi:Diaminohydroxyphosphoribosylaminopyrimidine deaminase [Pseudoalteromonas luteoviolacea B = ATCC 29581]|nr:Diaminohydroxyphosphoribosylaminopyrimidine deaminase [Pseudoalteromonas luteoviolacea B = ATCC 29581]